MMETARIGNHALSACPYCDELFDVHVDENGIRNAILDLALCYDKHLVDAKECRKKADDEPSLWEACRTASAAFKTQNEIRRERIADHPDNGKDGYWLVEGIRHDARTRASSAQEAIDKCATVVGSWESPEARFLGEELPEVF